MKIDTDHALYEWAERTAPGLDDDGWAGVQAIVDRHDAGPNESDHETRPQLCEDSPDVAKARALLAFRQMESLLGKAGGSNG